MTEENAPINEGGDFDIGTTCNSKTYDKKICNQTLYINPSYNDEGKIDSIQIYSTSKTGACISCFTQCIADLLTFCMRRIRNRNEAKLIIKACKNHKCLELPANENGIRSCPDAIAKALQEILGISDKELYDRPQQKEEN